MYCNRNYLCFMFEALLYEPCILLKAHMRERVAEGACSGAAVNHDTMQIKEKDKGRRVR